MLADLSGFNDHQRPSSALAAYDPRAVVALIQALPDSARKAPEKKDDWNAASIDAQIRLTAAEMLGLPVEERHRKASVAASDSTSSGAVRDRAEVSLPPKGAAMMTSSFSKCLLPPCSRWPASVPAMLARPPKFAGKSIPDPPRQKEPWTPPQTKLPAVPRLGDGRAVRTGHGRPAGCEYREVEVGDGQILKTRGFVLPERAGRGRPVRRQLGWRGLSGTVRRRGGRSGQGRPRRWPSP